ncbi:MAG: aldo/keto reductase [Gammaproteobacteria bacterium]|nr:aldo/keto reductase [Gammaproteobacteria bacterium]
MAGGSAINRKPLGNTEIQIPEIGLGTWSYHGGIEPLRRGLDAGALFIDTAESYGGAEEIIKDAITGMRDRVFLASKVSSHHLHHNDLKKAAEGSLNRLGVSHIDLYQIHQPNPAIPMAETIGAMEQLVDEGKICYIGVSNFNLEQLKEARVVARKYPIVANQVRYNLADRTIEDGLLQYCQENNITVIAYSPLAREMSRLYDCDPNEVLTQIAKETGRTVAQIAINWCLCKDGVVAIPKGNSVDHVLENCAASGWRLSEEYRALLDNQIQSRRRGRLDKMLRNYMPASVVPLAKQCLTLLPRGIRRRLS